jgi:hypothetical protein
MEEICVQTHQYGRPVHRLLQAGTMQKKKRNWRKKRSWPVIYISRFQNLYEGRQIIKSSVKTAFRELNLRPHKYELHVIIT